MNVDMRAIHAIWPTPHLQVPIYTYPTSYGLYGIWFRKKYVEFDAGFYMDYIYGLYTWIRYFHMGYILGYMGLDGLFMGLYMFYIWNISCHIRDETWNYI